MSNTRGYVANENTPFQVANHVDGELVTKLKKKVEFHISIEDAIFFIYLINTKLPSNVIILKKKKYTRDIIKIMSRLLSNRLKTRNILL